jgi:hypothetical protein
VGHDVDVAAIFREKVMPLAHPDGPGGSNGHRTSRAIGIFMRVAEVMAEDLVNYAQGWRPDLVVFDPITFAAPIAAAVTGVPAVQHLFGPDFIFGRAGRGPGPDKPGLAQLLARFGLADLQLRGAMTVDPCPPSLQVPGAIPRQLMSFVPYNGPGTAPRGPAATRRICITWGSTALALGGTGNFLPPEIITAARRSGAEVIIAVTAAQRGLLGSLPPGVELAESVPLQLLLPACTAVIHMGGAGTMLTAAALGLPQLMLPQLPEHRLVAQQAAATAAARCLPLEELTEDRAAAHIMALLEDPAHRNAALRLQQEIKEQPQPAEVVPTLEALVRRTADCEIY